jgi:hypothetical protein
MGCGTGEIHIGGQYWKWSTMILIRVCNLIRYAVDTDGSKLAVSKPIKVSSKLTVHGDVEYPVRNPLM